MSVKQISCNIYKLKYLKMKTRNLKVSSIILALTLSVFLINWTVIPGPQGEKASKINTLTKAEKNAGWRLLFDGKTLNGWRGIGRDHVPTGLWIVKDGVINKVNTSAGQKLPDGRPVEGGDLMTIETFDNFELSFEWKINKAGNSGLKYNVSEEMSEKNGSKYSALGFEYQLLDDGADIYKGKLKLSQFSGSLYDLLPSKNVVLKPIGEFNSSRILVDGKHVEHWLNGIKVLEYEFGSTVLDEAYKVSKFNKIAGFHDKRKAHIVLQNHNDESWFRNIKIRDLNK
jgi:hypothetical protein